MRATISCKTAQHKVINRQYIITSSELKKALQLEGTIQNLSLWRGLSPNDEAKGKSHEADEWQINTQEIKVLAKDNKEPSEE